MRLATLLLMVGCYAPHALPGSPCSATEPCADPLVCSPSTGTCELTAVGVDAKLADGPIDARSDAAPPVAPSFVQSRALSVTLPNDQGALAYNSAVTKDDLLVVEISAGSGTNTPTLVADTLGNTFTLLGPYNSSSLHQYLAYTIAATSGSDTVGVMLDSVPSSYFQIRLHEYQDVSVAAPLDVVATGTGTAAGTDLAVTSPFTTSSPDELIFATVTFANSGNAGTGFTRRTSLDGDVTEDMPAPTAKSYVATATAGSATGWLIVAAAFRGR